MKKAVSLLLAIVMLMSIIPLSAMSLNEYVVFGGREGCQLLDLQLTQADNAWLLYDVTFGESHDGRVLTTEQDHPGLVGAKAVLDLSYEGDTVYFNDVVVADGEAVKLNEKNDLVIYDSETKCRAEYAVNVTETFNGLPIVLIDTDNVAIETKLSYVDASISILGADVYGASDLYAAAATSTKKGGIKLRGNSTMGYDKKPYRIKFNSKENVLGMGKAKSWVLLANYLDPSAMRNQVAFNLADRVNRFTAETTGFEVFSPRMKPVEVYLNGEFKGLYDMGDHMQANELRVAINELGDEDVEYAGEEIGYFIEFEVQSRVLTEGADGYEDWSAYSWIEGVGSVSGKSQDPDTTDEVITDALYFQFKLPENPTDNQKAYITDYMQNINNLILANDESVWNLIDMDSVIDWYLVNEIFKNADSQMQSSVYFYKDGTLDEDGNAKEVPNTKLYMAPVWDFDLGAGGVAYGEMDDPTGWRTRNDEYCGWFREMFEMSSFKTALEARWANLHEKGILEAMFTDITALTESFGKAAPANYELWHQNYVDAIDGTWMTVPEVSTKGDWNAQVTYLNEWLKNRIAWMDGQYGYADETVNETVTVDAVLFENEIFTASSAGNVSKTYTIDELIDLDMLAFDLDINTTAAFNFSFDLTVAATINGESKTIQLTPSAMNDWQAPGSTVFDGTTGAYIAEGTYNDKVMTVSGALRWYIATYYLGGVSSSTVNLADYVNRIRLNSVTVTLDGATAGDTATFTLKNVDETTKEPAKVTKTVISGKPVIMGKGAVGNTLTASKVGVLPYGASLHYQWYVDGTAVSGATDTTYTVKASDLGKNITVAVTGTAYSTGTAQSDAVAITLDGTVADAPAAPTLNSITADTIIVNTADGCEYSLDGETWQTSGEFADLTAGAVYTVYSRVAATAVAPASAKSAALTVVTDVAGLSKGDVNADGVLNTSDAVLVLEQGLEFIDLNDAVKGDCDFNGDGKINTSDARAVLRYIVNSIN